MAVEVARGYNQSVIVGRGPLVYALSPGEVWTRIHATAPHRQMPHVHFEVRPARPWNYALQVDVENPAASVRFEERPVGEVPFSVDGAGSSPG